jgi:2-methylcitrate dehydratase PrpD
MSAASELAECAVAARAGAFPADAATAVFLDWCAVTVGGSRTPAARALGRALTGGGPCQVVGVSRTASAPSAALLNGVAAHVLELDDIYAAGLYHPGAPTIAAALAVAQERGLSGERLLRGIAVGYEVGNRVARALGAAHYRYWHSTGTAGSVAAAAAVAEVLELDASRFAHAVVLAATMGAGLQQTFRSDSMGKPLHSGHAGQAGVVAGLAAEEGFTGALDALDGEIGMGVAMSDSPSWEGVGARFAGTVAETTVKPYACCGHTFAAVDAALELHALGLPEVRAVEVETYGVALAVAGNPAPATPFEAKFSIPFVVTHALRTGSLPPEAFETRADPALLATVSLREGQRFTAAFPARRGARVTVIDGNGQRHEATVPDRRGDPANPLTPAQLTAKFTDLVGAVLGDERAVALAGEIQAVGALPDVRALELGPVTSEEVSPRSPTT